MHTHTYTLCQSQMYIRRLQTPACALTTQARHPDMRARTTQNRCWRAVLLTVKRCGPLKSTPPRISAAPTCPWYLKRCCLSMVMAVITRGCLPVPYRCSSSAAATMSASAPGHIHWRSSSATRGGGSVVEASAWCAVLPTRDAIPCAGLTCDCLCVRRCACTAASDVVCNKVNLLAILVRHCGARRGPCVRAQHNTILRGITRGAGPGLCAQIPARAPSLSPALCTGTTA